MRTWEPGFDVDGRLAELSLVERASPSHFIIKCSCGTVIAQCRCMGPKTEEIRQHPACEQT